MPKNDSEKHIYEAIVGALAYAPSQEQLTLIDYLLKFYFSDHSYPLFILRGYAGTGKTSTLSAFVIALHKNKRKTVLLAPTGRAAKVLAQRSEKTAYTIHKKIYRKQQSSDGAIRLELAPNLHTNTLFIIDEASMIPDYSITNDGTVHTRNLLEDLLEYVYSGKNCRLIFIGDHAQLPPVGSSFSPALSKNYLETNFAKFHLFEMELTKIHRQAEKSDILLNAFNLRSGILPLPFLEVENKNGLYCIQGNELQEALESAYTAYGSDETLIVTRSNKQANRYNQEVRGRILWFEEEINAGDVLMVVRNNYHWLDEKSAAGFIANGETLKVHRIRNSESMYNLTFADATVELTDYPQLDRFDVKLLLDTIYEDTPNLSRNKMKELFYAIEADYSWEKNKKKRYEKVMNDPYFNAIQVKFSYAVTCHKSQGGQWSCVFIDQGFFNEDMIDEGYFRWLYTAFTRASEKLYLVNFPGVFFKEK